MSDFEDTNVATIQRWVHEYSDGQVMAEPSPHPLGRFDWSFSRTDGRKVMVDGHECIGTMQSIVVGHSRKLDRRFTTVVWDAEHGVDHLLDLEAVDETEAPEGDVAQADSEQWEQDGGASEGGCAPWKAHMGEELRGYLSGLELAQERAGEAEEAVTEALPDLLKVEAADAAGRLLRALSEASLEAGQSRRQYRDLLQALAAVMATEAEVVAEDIRRSPLVDEDGSVEEAR